MAEYINAIHHPSPQPLSQISLCFDPKSPMNQNLLDKVQWNRMMAETFDEWLEFLMQQGVGYIANLIRVYEDSLTITQELET